MDYVVIAKYQGGLLTYELATHTFAVLEHLDGVMQEDTKYSGSDVVPGWNRGNTEDLLWRLKRGPLPGCEDLSVLEVLEKSRIKIDEQRNLVVDDNIIGRLVNQQQLDKTLFSPPEVSRACRYIISPQKEVLRIFWRPSKDSQVSRQPSLFVEVEPSRPRKGRASSSKGSTNKSSEFKKTVSKSPQSTHEQRYGQIGEQVVTLIQTILKEKSQQESSTDQGLEAVRTQLTELAQSNQRIELLLKERSRELEDALDVERKRTLTLEHTIYGLQNEIESANLRITTQMRKRLQTIPVIVNNYDGVVVENLHEKLSTLMPEELDQGWPEALLEAYEKQYELASNMLKDLRDIKQVLLENKLI